MPDEHTHAWLDEREPRERPTVADTAGLGQPHVSDLTCPLDPADFLADTDPSTDRPF